MIIDPEGAVDKSKGAWTLGTFHVACLVVIASTFVFC